MKKVDKKSIIISFIIIIIVGVFLARYVENRRNSIVEYGTSKADKPTDISVKESYEHVFMRGAKKVDVYKNNKKFKTYKKNKCSEILRIANDVYYRIYKNEPIEVNNYSYDVRYEFSSSRSFYMDTKSGKRYALFVREGKMYRFVLTKREYKAFKSYLKVSKKDKKKNSKKNNTKDNKKDTKEDNEKKSKKEK